MHQGTLSILRAVAIGKSIEATDAELWEFMRIRPKEYGDEGWIQVLWKGRVEAEAHGNHWRWCYYP